MFAMMSQNITKCNLNTGVIRAPIKHLKWSAFAQIVNILKWLTRYGKNSVLDVGRGSEYAYAAKQGVRCAKWTLDAARWNINLLGVCFEIFQWY